MKPQLSSLVRNGLQRDDPSRFYKRLLARIGPRLPTVRWLWVLLLNAGVAFILVALLRPPPPLSAWPELTRWIFIGLFVRIIPLAGHQPNDVHSLTISWMWTYIGYSMLTANSTDSYDVAVALALAFPIVWVVALRLRWYALWSVNEADVAGVAPVIGAMLALPVVHSVAPVAADRVGFAVLVCLLVVTGREFMSRRLSVTKYEST